MNCSPHGTEDLRIFLSGVNFMIFHSLPCLLYSCWVFFSFFLPLPNSWHVEVPGLGIEPTPQQDLSHKGTPGFLVVTGSYQVFVFAVPSAWNTLICRFSHGLLPLFFFFFSSLLRCHNIRPSYVKKPCDSPILRHILFLLSCFHLLHRINHLLTCICCLNPLTRWQSLQGQVLCFVYCCILSTSRTWHVVGV